MFLLNAWFLIPQIIRDGTAIITFKVPLACLFNVPSAFLRCPKSNGDPSSCKFFAWEDTLVSPDSQPTSSTPLKRSTSDPNTPCQEKRPRLDDGPTQSTQTSTQSSSQSTADPFSSSQPLSQPEAEYTLNPVRMLKGEEEESGLPTPPSTSRAPKPFACNFSRGHLLPLDHFPAQWLSFSDGYLHSSQIRTLERQKTAAEKERDARSRKIEYLESENKRYAFDSDVWSVARGLRSRFRLNESFQSVQNDVADHKTTVRALNAALLQYSQDSRSPGGRDAR
ncbi:uncharacterized protein EV420DRAFT_1669096 [Desarmillaria tabescens]|uniref:Zinc finger GRF-type domain-containing protein n=1 Tax=Armillaria tabescens TaxID=1929756 RepID=A0AA39N918_ARMTA|nr:uncharacterized protein EV420DRAFT_1669096 [Desarmillaria tabescens]KAK0461253.1 hypothetical protein EV420DRAFT_1669096 [Desarmillaria tabescens]